MWIYRTTGEPAGYVLGVFIHALDGAAVGRLGPIEGELNATNVYSLSGSYVGELYDQQVVDQGKRLTNIGPSGNPGNSGSRGSPGNRGARGCTYRDVFSELLR